MALAGDSDVLIVSDFNSTSGSPGGDIIFGAGSAINSTSASYAEYFPSASPRLAYAIIKGNTGYVGIGTDAPSSLLHVSGGDATISNGNLIFATSGKGIDFSSTNNGDVGVSGSVDSELLSDYEEGSWTVAISGSTSGGSYSYAVGTGLNQGAYTKIGNVVHVTGYLSASATTPLTGNVYITGLPFVSSGAERDRAYGLIGEYSGLANAMNVLTAQFVPGTDFFRIRKNTTESTALNTYLTGSDLNTSNVVFRFSAFYYAA